MHERFLVGAYLGTKLSHDLGRHREAAATRDIISILYHSIRWKTSFGGHPIHTASFFLFFYLFHHVATFHSLYQRQRVHQWPMSLQISTNRPRNHITTRIHVVPSVPSHQPSSPYRRQIQNTKTGIPIGFLHQHMCSCQLDMSLPFWT